MRTLLAVLVLCLGAALAITPAGTEIRNQASATVGDERYLSNEVLTLVRAVCVPALSPDGSAAAPGQSAALPAGGLAYLPFLLTNAGNAPFGFTLNWALHDASAWTPSEAALYLDADRNGRLDPGERALERVRLEVGAEAALLLALRAPEGARGAALASAVASCPDGRRDGDNYARLEARAGPALSLAKSVEPARPAPGERVRFTLTLRNAGGTATDGEVELVDELAGDELAGLRFAVGSAVAAKGRLAFFAGGRWHPDAPADPQAPGEAAVEAVKLTLPALAAGEEAVLRFAMEVAADAAPGTRRNTARAQGPGGPVEAWTQLRVAALHAHHLGPAGNPRALPGGEASDDDAQRLERAHAGQPACFPLTLENAGNTADTYTLHASDLPPGAAGVFQGAGGAPLGQPLQLDPGAALALRYCLTPAADGGNAPVGGDPHGGLDDGLTVTLRARSGAGRDNRSEVHLGRVEGPPAVRLHKEVSPQGPLGPGAELRYTLTVHNEGDRALHEVIVTDDLQPLQRRGGDGPELLLPGLLHASDGGRYDAARRRLQWRLGDLAAGETRQLSVALQLPDREPDGTLYSLVNSFSLRAAEVPDPLRSNEVATLFPAAVLLIDKRAETSAAQVGESLAYTVTVANPNPVALPLVLRDLPPERTRYLPDSARLRLGETEVRREPREIDGALVWDLRDDPALLLEAAGSERARLELRYELAVLPGADGELLNRAQAFGRLGAGESVVAVASAEVSARIPLDPRSPLAPPPGLLLGRVYLDQDDDGTYTPERDRPLAGARVLLANGWQALTDVEGRYAFRALEPGPWALMLDPASAPYEPLERPEAVAPYRHLLQVHGVTVSDFPLAAPRAAVEVSRATHLRFGPLEIRKQLRPRDGRPGAEVELQLHSDELLEDLTIRDPLPAGGVRTFRFDRFQGRLTLRYRLDEAAPLTDPDARWSYP